MGWGKFIGTAGLFGAYEERNSFNFFIIVRLHLG